MTDDGALLAWTADSRAGNNGFFVERGNDGINFSTIGYMVGKQGQPANYTFADGTPTPGKNLYRLKQVNADGTTIYSKTITLDWDRVMWTVYPNPSYGKVTVSLSLNTPLKVSLRLLGIDGRVHSNIEKGILGTGSQQVSVNPPVRGLYRVELTVGGKVYFKTISRL